MLARSFLIQVGSTVFLAALQLVSISLLSRIISPPDFGYVATASVAIFVGVSLSDVGFGASLVRRRKLSVNFVNLVLTLSFAVFGVVCLVAFLAMALIWHDYKITALSAIFSIGAYFTAAAGVLKSLLQRDLMYWKLFQINGFSYLIGMILCAATLAFLDFGAFAIAWGQLVYGFSMFVLAAIMTRVRFRPSYSRRLVGPLLNFGGYVSLARVMETLLTEGDKLFMAVFAGFEKVGTFERLNRISLISGGHGTFIIDSVLYPQLCRDVQRRDLRSSINPMIFMSALSSLAFMSAATLSSPLLKLILGENYLTLTYVLPSLLLASYLRVQSRPFEVFLRALGRPQIVVFSKITPSFLLILSLVLLSSQSIMIWAWCFVIAQICVLLSQGAMAVRLGLPTSLFGLVVGLHSPVTAGLMLWLGGQAGEYANPFCSVIIAAVVLFFVAALLLSFKTISGISWSDLRDFTRREAKR